nr:Chain s, Model substrate polypeptide [Homo sapiens]
GGKHTFNNENVSARLGGASIAVQAPAQPPPYSHHHHHH